MTEIVRGFEQGVFRVCPHELIAGAPRSSILNPSSGAPTPNHTCILDKTPGFEANAQSFKK